MKTDKNENGFKSFPLAELLDIMTAFNMSTSYTSVEEAKTECPNLFKSKREAAKEWVLRLVKSSQPAGTPENSEESQEELWKEAFEHLFIPTHFQIRNKVMNLFTIQRKNP